MRPLAGLRHARTFTTPSSVLASSSYRIQIDVREAAEAKMGDQGPRLCSAVLCRNLACGKGFSGLQLFFGGIQPAKPHPSVLVMKVRYVHVSYSL